MEHTSYKIGINYHTSCENGVVKVIRLIKYRELSLFWFHDSRWGYCAPHNKGNREKKTENKNFNLSEIISEIIYNTQFPFIIWNPLFKTSASFTVIFTIFNTATGHF